MQLHVVYTAGDQTRYEIIRSQSAICGAGWLYFADRNEVEICGSTCDRIRTDPGAQIEVLLACSGGGPLIR
jgi:hypothetical protein